jgi:hypothetical protein
MITALPAFDLLADLLDHRESALNAVGAGKRLPEFGWQVESQEQLGPIVLSRDVD